MHMNRNRVTWSLVSSLESRVFVKQTTKSAFFRSRKHTAGFVQFILIHNSTIRDAILARRLLNERKELRDTRYFVIPAFLFEIHLRWLGNEIPGKLESISSIWYYISKFFVWFFKGSSTTLKFIYLSKALR